MSDPADFLLSLVRTVCQVVMTVILCYALYEYLELKREARQALQQTATAMDQASRELDAQMSSLKRIYQPNQSLEDIKKEQARRALGIPSKQSFPSDSQLQRAVERGGQELAMPLIESLDAYNKRLLEDQRLREEKRAEEKARLDSLPNGPRQK
jgi:hypothetical protein